MFYTQKQLDAELLKLERVHNEARKDLVKAHADELKAKDRFIDEKQYSNSKELTLVKDKYTREIELMQLAHKIEKEKLVADHEIALSRARAKWDEKEIELMGEVRKANNDAELTKHNAELVAERITADAESRIATAERAAAVVLSNAQLEATQIVASGKARGEEMKYQIMRTAQESIVDLYDDIIDTLTTKIPLEQIDLTKVRELIIASTANFPKTVSGEVTVTNSNSK